MLLLMAADLCAAPRPDQVPLFRLRVRVVSLAGIPPEGHTFPVQFGTGRDVIHGADWSAWMSFDRQQATTAVSTYPATYIPEWPLVLHVQIGGVADTTVAEAELRFDENLVTNLLRWRAFGPALGFLVWRDEHGQVPRTATMAGYNQRYWAELQETGPATSP